MLDLRHELVRRAPTQIEEARRARGGKCVTASPLRLCASARTRARTHSRGPCDANAHAKKGERGARAKKGERGARARRVRGAACILGERRCGDAQEVRTGPGRAPRAAERGGTSREESASLDTEPQPLPRRARPRTRRAAPTSASLLTWSTWRAPPRARARAPARCPTVKETGRTRQRQRRFLWEPRGALA